MRRIYNLLLCSLILLFTACEKDTLPTQFAPNVKTGEATDIYRKGAVLSGSIQMTGTATAKSYGILFSELESMTEYTEYAITNNDYEYSVSLSNLTPNTTYYYCAYANSGYSITKGQVKSFTTLMSNAPIFTEVTLLEKDEFSCKISVSLVDDGGSEITLSGFCWNKQGEGTPTTESHIHNVAISGNSMSAVIEGLEPNSVYQVRAYATNSDGVGYSEVATIQTAEATAPVLSAITMKESSDFSVTVEAQITDSGTSAVTKAGFCWSTSNGTPTVNDETNDLTSQLTAENQKLTASLSELQPNTTYYIRAYATNGQGTSYSEVFTFTTAEAQAPTLSAITQKESSDFSVTVEAQVTDAGTSAVSKVGFCWSTTKQTPTIEDNSNNLTSQLTNGNTTFSATLSNMTPNATYYIRAYAINGQGTSYSEVFTYKTPYKDTDNGDTGLNDLPTTKWE